MYSKKYDNLNEAQLVALIKKHDDLYWNNATPEILDEEYDYIVRSLQSLNPDHPILLKVHSPVVIAGGKVRHSKPMLSLEKAYSLDILLEWAGKYARNKDELFIIQPKYDGISANFDGKVLATRGDGEFGENITDKISLIELESPEYRGLLNRPVRGEIVIRNDDFKTKYSKIRRNDGSLYKNSRNAVAGIMGLKDISSLSKQGAKLTLVDYSLISYTVRFKEFEEKWSDILKKIEDLPYTMYGLVIKLADEKYAESLGYTAQHPRGQIAFKFSGVRKKTELLDVEWSFGKNCLTPVALMKPVEIGGITIKHASLHNIQNIIDKDIMIGDIITVERAGDVIPYVVASFPGDIRRSCLIEQCPCCSSELIRRGPEFMCPNAQCPEVMLQRLLASIRSIGIERLGEPTVRRIMHELGVKNLKDIFYLTYDDLIKLEGFQEKSVNNLLKEIEKARHAEAFQVLTAMNIPNIGPNVAKAILKKYSLSELPELNAEELALVDGIGVERATAIIKVFKESKELFDDILSCINLKEVDKNFVELPKICFTGKMPQPRAYYEKIAKTRGFDAVSSVTSDLTVLVALDKKSNSSKIKKARKAGVKIMSLDEWLNDSAGTSLLGNKGNDIEESQSEVQQEKLDDSYKLPEQMDFGF
jgi:DNA ligase (NAD+)